MSPLIVPLTSPDFDDSQIQWAQANFSFRMDQIPTGSKIDCGLMSTQEKRHSGGSMSTRSRSAKAEKENVDVFDLNCNNL